MIDEEKKETRAEVKSFDKTKLKHVKTEEKTATPTAEGKTNVSETTTKSSEPSNKESQKNNSPSTTTTTETEAAKKKSCTLL